MIESLLDQAKNNGSNALDSFDTVDSVRVVEDGDTRLLVEIEGENTTTGCYERRLVEVTIVTAVRDCYGANGYCGSEDGAEVVSADIVSVVCLERV